jgi:predicted dinucleotide-binding enzyme
MKLAIVGSGNVGKALATSALRGGHEVTLTASSAEHAAEASAVVSDLGAELEGVLADRLEAGRAHGQRVTRTRRG